MKFSREVWASASGLWNSTFVPPGAAVAQGRSGINDEDFLTRDIAPSLLRGDLYDRLFGTP